MGEDTPFGGDPTTEYGRVLLVACCLLAVVVAGTVLPAVSGGEGVAGSPIESTLPDGQVGPQTNGSGPGPGGPGSGGGGSSLGALNPGDTASVGGPVSENPYRSLSAETHFTVRSSQPAYWRTGAFGTYTGAGWTRADDGDRYNGPVSGPATPGDRVSYEVTLAASATSLPSVYRPQRVSGLDADVLVTDRQGLVSTEPLRAGTSYEGTSVRPARTPDLLRETGRDYPPSVAGEYATLPRSVPTRVRTFTSNLTADADNPYETATRVEAWLEANKEYSLNASARSEQIADTFIFEMDRGYCEYFATAMTVMLRSQGIPARYVVGYSTGQQIDEGVYQVRSLNAHAWVEVYFEGVGWVKFDPTPGSSRLARERAAVQQAESGPDEEYDPREVGSPGERFSSDGETGDPAGDEALTRRTETGVRVALNRTPAPGATVRVTLTEDGAALSNRTVLFNGDPVGATDRSGTLVATVPYAETLRVSLAGETTGGAAASLSGEALYALPGPRLADVEYPVDTAATVRVSGRVRPGGEVTVRATVGEVPVRDATVLVDGEPAGRTGADGTATVRLPARTGEVAVAVRRGPVTGSTTVAVDAVEVAVRPSTPLPLPFAGATVTATRGGRPVPGLAVRVDGRRVGTTGADGRLSVSLPAATRATVTVVENGVASRTTVGNMLANLTGTVLALLATVALGLAVARNRAGGVRAALAAVLGLPRRAARAAVAALVAVATRGDELLVAAVVALSRASRAVRAVLRGRVGLGDLRQALWRRLGRGEGEAGTTGADEVAGSVTVRGAWRRVVDRASVGRPETKTPGELAAHAVRRDGLPREPVTRLRDAFRAVEYGPSTPEERSEPAREALAAIEDEGDRDGAAEPGEDGERQ